MARNGVEFGIRVSGTGDQWFTGPAAIPQGLYLPTAYPPGAQTPPAPMLAVPAPAPGYQQPQPQPYAQPQPQPQVHPQAQAPQPQPSAPHTPTVRAAPGGDDLQQLGELLRRQAGDGRP